MSDKELVELIRSAPWSDGFPYLKETADRIEELEAELRTMKTSGIAEVAVRNPSVMEYMQHWEGRAEAAESKLAKAVEACANVAKRMADEALTPVAREHAEQIAEAILEELKSNAR